MYSYSTEMKSRLFTEEMQEVFLQVRDKVSQLLSRSGAVKMSHILEGLTGNDVWDLMACVDRLKELEEINEILQQGIVPGQNRIFVRNR